VKDLGKFKMLREMKVKDISKWEVGQKVGCEIFEVGEIVDVSGATKGRGFAGVVKKWGMKGAARDSSTSHEHHRHIGAVGQRKTPGKVWKGKHLPGQYGNDNVTIQNLKVVGIEADKNLLLVSGSVPGHADGLLFVDTAVKGQPRPKKKQEERARAKPKV
jgi:large subunit ribosomal protein L3